MNILDRVKDIIVEQTGVDPQDVAPESLLIDDFQMDSMDQLELQTTLEEEFDIRFNSQEFDHIRTIQDIADFVQSKIS